MILRDICTRVDYGYTTSATDEPVGPKFLRITDIVPELIDWEDVPYCEIPESKLDKYRLREGDIVIARTGATTGYAKYIKGEHDSVFASYLVRLRIAPAHDARFIGYIVESQEYKDFITLHRGGAAQPNANAQVLSSYPVDLPPVETQRRIAGILSAYDDLIETNTRRIRVLEEMARALYREWFVHYRFPGHEDVAMVEQADLGEVPEGWEVRPLGETCHLILGQSPKSEYYNEDGEGLPFHQGVADFGHRFPTHRVYCTQDKRTAEVGDILFSVRAPVGRINVADRKLVLGRGLHAIRSKAGQQRFVLHQLQDRFYEEDMMGGGAIFKAVTKKDMLGIPLLAPPSEIAADYSRRVDPIEDQVETLTKANENLRQTRDLLLPRLVSGALPVEAAEAELAEAA